MYSSKVFLRFTTRCLSTIRFCCLSNQSQCHYEVLGVPKSAGKKEIREAYLQKTKKYHPDRNLSDLSLHEKFVKVTNAYQVLGDDVSRNLYNSHMENPVTRAHSARRTRSNSTTASNPFGNYADDDPYRDWDEEMKRKMYDDFYKHIYPEYLDERNKEWQERRRKNKIYLLAILCLCLSVGLLNFSRIWNFHQDYRARSDQITAQNAAYLADRRTGYRAYVKRRQLQQKQQQEEDTK